MAASLFEHGAIRTTEAKAKELRRFAEKLITMARKGTLHARRRVIAELQDWHKHEFDENKSKRVKRKKTVVDKLFDEIAPRYADRPGGYTRIIRLAERRIGDAGRQVLLQLVEETGAEENASRGSSRRRQRAAKRFEAVGKASRGRKDDEVADEQAEVEQDEVKQDEADQTAEATSDDQPDEGQSQAEPADDDKDDSRE